MKEASCPGLESGSAVAVARGICRWLFGADTAGSVAFGGLAIFGLKPSLG
jgi:Asp-tRNA(Asn)/Glu-tRNA(Gln) amidotransferase A subunit family amidase